MNKIGIMNKFAERLKSLRLEKGLTQIQLAEAASMSQAGIAKLELGERSPNKESIIALAKALGCTTDYLLCVTDY